VIGELNCISNKLIVTNTQPSKATKKASAAKGHNGGIMKKILLKA